MFCWYTLTLHHIIKDQIYAGVYQASPFLHCPSLWLHYWSGPAYSIVAPCIRCTLHPPPRALHAKESFLIFICLFIVRILFPIVLIKMSILNKLLYPLMKLPSLLLVKYDGGPGSDVSNVSFTIFLNNPEYSNPVVTCRKPPRAPVVGAMRPTNFSLKFLHLTTSDAWSLHMRSGHWLFHSTAMLPVRPSLPNNCYTYIIP